MINIQKKQNRPCVCPAFSYLNDNIKTIHQKIAKTDKTVRAIKKRVLGFPSKSSRTPTTHRGNQSKASAEPSATGLAGCPR